jgi:Mg-chelatase subunit ChlD
METKHQVHNLIILDESGSMESIKRTIIQGFNEIVQTVKGIEKNFPEQEHFISLVTFNGLGQKLLHFIDPVSKLEQIDNTRYQPDSMTPLFDAIGFSVTKLRQVLEGKTDYDVLVTILTDGEENSSKEYTGKAISQLINELKLNHWTFTYIGTDHNVEEFAATISITNTMTFQKNEAGMQAMFSKERSTRQKYSQNIREKKDPSQNFYEEDDAKN